MAMLPFFFKYRSNRGEGWRKHFKKHLRTLETYSSILAVTTGIYSLSSKPFLSCFPNCLHFSNPHDFYLSRTFRLIYATNKPKRHLGTCRLLLAFIHLIRVSLGLNTINISRNIPTGMKISLLIVTFIAMLTTTSATPVTDFTIKKTRLDGSKYD